MSDSHHLHEPPPPSGEGSSAPKRQVALVKGAHRYIFRYAPGEEARLLQGLTEMAKDSKCDLNWFDAAVLSHQLGQRIGQQLDRILKP